MWCISGATRRRAWPARCRRRWEPEDSRAAAAGLKEAWRAAETSAGKPLTVILDQVEELFTRPNAELPDELESLLAAMVNVFAGPGPRPQGRLILSFRKEWLAEIETRLKERGLPRAKVFLERLDRRGIVEAIAGPARSARLRDRYGLGVAEGLPDEIAGDLLGDPGSPVAPMLQILLTGMWAAAKARDYDRPRFDQALYAEMRAKGLGLDDFLARQLAGLHEKQAQAVESGLAIDLLACHTTPLGTAEQRTAGRAGAGLPPPGRRPAGAGAGVPRPGPVGGPLGEPAGSATGQPPDA